MDEVKDKKIALIGGAGFIGHNLALELVKLGAKVTIFDAFSVIICSIKSKTRFRAE